MPDDKNKATPTLVVGMMEEASKAGKFEKLEELLESSGFTEFTAQEVAAAIPDVLPGKSIEEAVSEMEKDPDLLEKVILKTEEIIGGASGGEEKFKGMSAQGALDKMGDEMSDEPYPDTEE